jgi:hypothetical protein
MTYTLTIACLANSRKRSGRCIAGRLVTNAGLGAWIRPVSDRPDEEISEEERRYENGLDPQVLDVVAIVMRQPKPSLYQRENHLIDASYYWERAGSMSWAELQRTVENPEPSLWINGHSSHYGQNDRVPEALARALRRSLYLIHPENLTITVAREGTEFGNPRRRVRARFHLHRQSYYLAVTDPRAERRHLCYQDGEYPLNEALLCVSLGELYNGFAYKLAATVIVSQRAETP